MQRGTNFKKALQKADRRLYLEMVEEAFQDWLHWKNKQEREHNAVVQEQERSLKALKDQEKRLREDVARVNREMWLKKKAEEKKREDTKKQKLKQAMELQKKEREIMCKKSVEKWMKEARYKPKPTRSNLGLASHSTGHAADGVAIYRQLSGPSVCTRIEFQIDNRASFVREFSDICLAKVTIGHNIKFVLGSVCIHPSIAPRDIAILLYEAVMPYMSSDQAHSFLRVDPNVTVMLCGLVCTNVGKMNPIPWKDIVEKDGTD